MGTGPVEGTVLGIVLGLVVKFFWDRWNREYITKGECDSCPTKSTEEDIKVMKEVLLELAVKAGIPIDKYKSLMR